ncbi:MAG: asparagine synthase-related protein, partial [Acidobacteriaceae bacterium]
VLTGMCGDAVFIGDSPEPFFLADLRNPRTLFSQLRLWEKDSPQRRSLAFWFMRYVVEPHRAPVAPTPPSWICDSHRANHHDIWSQASRPSNPCGLSAGDNYFWDRVLRGALSTRDGQQPFSDLCQFRNPWLSLPLVEFMAATPWPIKLHPQPDRVLQRNALRGILPEPTRLRVGKGVPTQALIAGLKASDEWFHLLTDCPAIVDRGYVHPQLWRRAVDLARHGLCESPAGFMRACMLEGWFHTLDLKPRSAPESTSQR